MDRRSSWAASFAAVLLLVSPVAVGSWSSLGGSEPDTSWDRTAEWMWQDSNPTKVRKAYLNVVPSIPDASANPNVGLLGSRVMPFGKVGFEAFYGVWIDCNQDGYIGNLETLQIEYRYEQGLNMICAPGDGSGTVYADVNPVSTNWVSELLWIGPPGGADGNGDGRPDGRDARLVHDVGARVWGDYGVPGDAKAQNFCVGAADIPRGTYQSTGAFLNHYDCYLGGRAFDATQTALGAAGMGFDAEHRQRKDFAQEGHPLHRSTLGRPDYNQTMVRAWDCSGDAQRVMIATSEQKTPEQAIAGGYNTPYVVYADDSGALTLDVHWNQTTGTAAPGEDDRVARRNVTYRVPTVSGADPSGSPAGTVAYVTRGAGSDAIREDRPNDCRAENNGENIYAMESDALNEKAGAKSRVTVRFGFFEEQRSGAGKRGNPFEGGAYPVMRGTGAVITSGTRWWYEPGNDDPPTLPQAVRTSDLQPEGGIYWTFYANFTAFAAAKGVVTPTGGTGIYGSEFCAGETVEIRNGMVCDKTKWYRNPDGSYMTDAQGRRLVDYWPTPGHAYQLRDVDCFDGTLVQGVPVHASLVDLNEQGGC